MKILIDADACPVTDIAIKIAKEFSIECILVCDTSHEIVRGGIETIVVSKGADSTDFALVNMISKGDVVITQDYGLASMCLSKKAYVMNQNGFEFNGDNIVYLMETRYAAKKLRMSGKHMKGPKPRKSENDLTFEKNFWELILKIKDK